MLDLFSRKSFPLRYIKSLFLLLIITVLFACNNRTDNNKTTSVDSQSSNGAGNWWGSSIYLLKLPFADTCYDTIPVQKPALPDSLSKLKVYGQIIGKISENKYYTALLYSIPADVQLPVLHTFTLKGERISSLKLFIGNCCGENEGCIGLSTVVITPDLHIILKDSTETFERDKKNLNKKRNIQFLKRYEEYMIDSIGKIIRINHPGK